MKKILKATAVFSLLLTVVGCSCSTPTTTTTTTKKTNSTHTTVNTTQNTQSLIPGNTTVNR